MLIQIDTWRNLYSENNRGLTKLHYAVYKKEKYSNYKNVLWEYSFSQNQNLPN